MSNRANLSNDIAVKNLKWTKDRPSQFRVRDNDRMGFYIRVHKSGRKTWEYRYPVGNGKYGYKKIGNYPATGCAEALAAYEELRDLVKNQGRDPKEIEAKAALTLSKLFDDHFLPRYAKKYKKSWPEDLSNFDLHVRSRLGDVNVYELNSNQIYGILHLLTVEEKYHTARKVKALLNKVFRWAGSRASMEEAGDEPLFTLKNPCEGIELQKPPESDNTMLTTAELKNLWEALGDKLPSDRILKLLILTGCRCDEIAGLRWSEIDWGANRIHLPANRTKPKREHVIPLTNSMIELIGQGKGEFVFASKSKTGHIRPDSVWTALSRKCANKKLGLTKVSPNGLRDNFISHMARLGVHLEIRDRLTNHANASVDGRHYNAYDYFEDKRLALEKWDEEIKRICAKKDGGNKNINKNNMVHE